MAGTGKAHLRPSGDALLRAEDLTVEFPIGTTGQVVHAVSGISLDLIEGETLGLVGESGCGKSTTGKAIMQIPRPTDGSVTLDSVELTELDSEAMRRTRPVLQMIFQDPISALNPRRTVRDIIAEPLVVWWEEEEEGRPVISIWFDRWSDIFVKVARVVTKPMRFLVPLAALALVLWILGNAVDDRALSDELGWIEPPAQAFVLIMAAAIGAIGAVLGVMGMIWLFLGLMVPFGLMSRLLGDIPKPVGLAGAALAAAIAGFMVYRTWNSWTGIAAWVLRVNMIAIAAVLVAALLWSVVRYSRAGPWGVAVALAAIFGVQLFYIAGLDGVPKLGVIVASAVFDYLLFLVVRRQLGRRRDALRARAEPKVREMLETVGINPDNAMDRKPFEFSGGQAQRISIARALILDPKVIICDEPVSALDVSVQAQILNLLEEMKERYGLTLVFIAHDLAVVKNVSDRVAVMYLGKICEVADPDVLYANPAHPYSQLLLSAIPHPDPLVEARVSQEASDLPSPVAPPSGCRFRTRCPLAQPRCAEEEPIMRKVSDDQYVACHFPLVDVVDDASAEDRSAAASNRGLSDEVTT